MIPQHEIDRVKSVTNIVDVIGARVELKKAGREYRACCPFHGEKTPSFTVNEAKQFFHCFGCGVNGSVIDFVMEWDRCDFREAVAILGGNTDLDDCGPAPREQIRTRAFLPLPWQKPHPVGELKRALASCEAMKSPDGEVKFFANRCQMITVTDVYGVPVSLAMIEGPGFPVRHYKKEFLWGSCVILGDLDGEVAIVVDWHQAARLHYREGKNVICAFEELNVRFILKYARINVDTASVMRDDYHIEMQQQPRRER